MLKQEWVKEVLMFPGNLQKSSGRIWEGQGMQNTNYKCLLCAMCSQTPCYVKPNAALGDSNCFCFTNRETLKLREVRS